MESSGIGLERDSALALWLMTAGMFFVYSGLRNS